jgi:hypothetical protein
VPDFGDPIHDPGQVFDLFLLDSAEGFSIPSLICY